MNPPEPGRPELTDLDATDELPMLDLAETGRSPALDDPLARTDTWHATALQAGERERIAVLEEELQERDAIVHSLRGDLAVTTSDRSRLETDLESILGNLGALEARLREIEGHNAILEERLRQSESDLAATKGALSSAEAAEAGLASEREQLVRRLAEHELAASERAGQLGAELDRLTVVARTAETELASARATIDRYVAENSAQQAQLGATLQVRETLESASRGSALRLQQLERELATAEARIVRYLEVLQTSEARQRYVEDCAAAIEADRLGTEQAQIELQRELATSRASALQLSTELAAQQVEVGRLEQLLSERGDLTATLQSDLRQRADSLTRLERELTSATTESAALHARLAEREAGIAAATEVTRQLREQLAEAARSASAQAAAESLLIGERDALQRQVGTLDAARVQANERVQQLEIEVRRAEERYTELQQSFAAQGEELEGWREVASRLGNSDAEIRSRDERIRALEQQLAFVHDQQADSAAELDTLRGEHEKLRGERDERAQRVTALEGELSARADVLEAIRRDIGRIGDTPAPTANETLVRTLTAMEGDSEVVHVLSRKVLSIGRTPENDIPVDSKHVSRRHARLLVGPTAVILEDLGSTNGCFVNGRRIRKQVLHDGDLVIVGKTRFRFASHLATG